MSRSTLGRTNCWLVEAQITRIRARQVELIRHLDRYQVDTADGARTMGDWTSAQLDVSYQTASRLTQLAHHPDPEIDRAMAEGRWGLDRAAALTKLRTAGIDPDLFAEAAENYSLGRLYGLLDRLRHLSPADEEDVFADRYLVIQPNLDESVFKLWGQLPGIDGRIVEKALSAREAELPILPQSGAGATAGRRFDLHLYGQPDRKLRRRRGGGAGGDGGRSVHRRHPGRRLVRGDRSGDRFRTRVGPNTLSEILCTGKIRVIVTDGLHPVAYSDLGEAIPPATRSFVLWRDQGQCSIEGCPSRYRLQPHHITQRAWAATMIPTT